MPAVTMSVAPHQLVSSDAGDLFPIRPAHLAIGEDSELMVSVAYESVAEIGSPAHVRETRVSSKGWGFFMGNWQVVFDGFACVNTGVGPTDVRLHQFDSDGNLLMQREIIADLAPGGKGLYVIGSPSGSEFTLSENGYFELWSDEPLVLIALRGTPPTVTEVLDFVPLE